MTAIVSPTTTERTLRTIGLLALFGFFSGWFLYDATVGYPHKNLKKAVEVLDPVPDELPPINERVTSKNIAALIPKQGEPTPMSEFVEKIGEPGWKNEAGDSAYYFGPGGRLRLGLVGERVVRAEFTEGVHTEMDLSFQKVLGGMLVPLTLVMLLQLVRVVTTRVELSDAGLKVRGRSPIPFDAMQNFDATNYKKKGWLELAYQDGDRTRTVRLDDYVIREFRPIVAEICARCGFDDPLPQQQSEVAQADSASSAG